MTDNGFFPSSMIRGATISPCGKYRYTLIRAWKEWPTKSVTFVMLNPSKADAMRDDPTIIRCMNFAKAWGYDALTVVNLFAYRATKPKELLTVDNPIGDENFDTLMRLVNSSADIVAAWGGKVPFDRDWEVMNILKRRNLYCLGLTKHGYPRHPLFCCGDTKLILFRDALGVFEPRKE